MSFLTKYVTEFYFNYINSQYKINDYLCNSHEKDNPFSKNSIMTHFTRMKEGLGHVNDKNNVGKNQAPPKTIAIST